MSLFKHLKSAPGLMTAAVLATTMLSGIVRADLVINEVFFDPSGDPDTNEYIELRGTANMSLSGYYLVVLENEVPNATTGQPGYGYVEAVFNLGNLNGSNSATIGSNGFALIMPKGNGYTIPSTGANVYTNAGSGAGFGAGGNSTIGFSSVNGYVENSGFTVLLIHVDSGGTVPTVGQNYDMNNVDDATVYDPVSGDPITDKEIHWLNFPSTTWTLVDSVGVDAELETNGVLYGAINFGGRDSSGLISLSADDVVFDPISMHYVLVSENHTIDTTNTGSGGKADLGEIEYVGRWGDSTTTDGSAPGDWFVGNLKKSGPPYTLDTSTSGGFRGIRGDYSSISSAYFTGHTNVTDTLGSTNHH